MAKEKIACRAQKQKIRQKFFNILTDKAGTFYFKKCRLYLQIKYGAVCALFAQLLFTPLCIVFSEKAQQSIAAKAA